MPSNLLNADTSFPQFTRETSDSEKIEKLTSYLFMLLEQLRYSLANLDKDNFNDAGLDEIGKIITDPVYVRLTGAEGGIHELNVTAKLLSSRIEDAEGSVSQLQQTARTLTSRIAGTEGNVSSLQQTAQSLSSRISDAEGNVSSLTQTVNGMRLSVVNGENSSTITLTANGTAISSQNIWFSGMVTFSGLSAGTTTINGACIKTGTISAVNISSCTIEGCTFRSVMQGYGSYGGEIQFCYLYPSWVAGGIRLDDQGAGTSSESRYRMFLYTNYIAGISFAMKLQSAGGMSLTCQSDFYLSAGAIVQVHGPTGIELYGPVRIQGSLTVNGKTIT